MTELLLAIIGTGVILAIDLILVAARSSFSQISNARLLGLREQMGERVARTLIISAVLPRLRASLNLGLVLTRFTLAVMVMALVSLGSLSPRILALILALLAAALLTFWLEWAAERAVSHSPEIWAVRLTAFVRLIMIGAMVFLLPLGLGGDKTDGHETAGIVTEDELKNLVDAGQEEGVFELGERRMIHSIFQLGDTLAREIMVPRIDMMALDVRTAPSQAVDALLQSGHSRVPVFEDTVDNTLGLLYAKDLLRLWREGGQPASLQELLRPAYFVPEAKKVDELLEEMQARRIHMAIVVDEYGGVAGLLTLEDIVEEIIGEVRDEYDQAEEAPYQEVMEGGYLFLGRIDLDDFNEVMGSNLPKDEADTLAGYIYGRLGRVPAVGENVRDGELLLTVEQVSSRRIRKVRATWVLPDTQTEKENHRADR